MRMMKLLHALGIHAWGPSYWLGMVERRMCFLCSKLQERAHLTTDTVRHTSAWRDIS